MQMHVSESQKPLFSCSLFHDGRDHSLFSGWGSSPSVVHIRALHFLKESPRISSFSSLRHGFITGSLFPEWLSHHLCYVVQCEQVVVGHTSIFLPSPYYMLNPTQMKWGHLGHLREYPLQLFHSTPIMTYSPRHSFSRLMRIDIRTIKNWSM